MRYKTGDTDEWVVNDQVPLDELHPAMARTFRDRDIISFGTEARSGVETDYGFAWIRMADVVMFEIDGMVDASRIASWSPGQNEA